MSSALRRAVARDFPGPAAVAAAPGHRAHLRGYLADLAAPYRVALREPMFDDACGQSYGEMAATLLAEVLPPDEAVDLLVLAFAVPDIRPGRSTATYLSHICPGRPLAFAICDQGAAAGFTGLRLILSYARDRERRRAVLLVVEQAALH
ncbi:MAG TPA: 2-hydroxy-acid oxidase, partial [Rugosimonospora sp.]|nr:2-hydroxy-acid oxidase [Rugosimonospora sp.]